MNIAELHNTTAHGEQNMQHAQRHNKATQIRPEHKSDWVPPPATIIVSSVSIISS